MKKYKVSVIWSASISDSHDYIVEAFSESDAIKKATSNSFEIKNIANKSLYNKDCQVVFCKPE
jgi:hypothetical protein